MNDHIEYRLKKLHHCAAKAARARFMLKDWELSRAWAQAWAHHKVMLDTEILTRSLQKR